KIFAFTLGNGRPTANHPTCQPQETANAKDRLNPLWEVHALLSQAYAHPSRAQKHSPNNCSEVFALRMHANFSSEIRLPTHFSIMVASIEASMAFSSASMSCSLPRCSLSSKSAALFRISRHSASVAGRPHAELTATNRPATTSLK